MANFKNIISITESDTLYGLTNSNDVSGYSDGTEDTHTWGEPLNLENGKLSFSKKYVTFTFVIERVSSTDFRSPRNISMDIEYDNGTSTNGQYPTMRICTNLNLADASGNAVLIYGSRSTDATLPDKTAFIRVEVSTMRLYNIGKIRKIWCKIDYTDTNIIDGRDYELNKNFWFVGDQVATLYKGHQWYKGSWNTQLTTDSGAYSTRVFGPSSSPRGGSMEAYSSVIDNGTAGTTQQFFTGKDGEIVVKINKIQFCSDSDNGNSYRYPSDYFFTGKEKGKNTEKTERITKIDSNSTDLWTPGKDDTKYIIFKTSDNSFFDGFENISKIEVCFGGDLSNKKTIFDKKMLNIDVDSNLKMEISYENGGSNRINYISSISKEGVKLYSHIKGKISRGDNSFLIFPETIKLVKDNKEYRTISITKKDNNLEINDQYFYDCKVVNNALNLNNSPFVAGNYKMRCNIKNKLKVHNQTNYERTFEINNLSFSNDFNDKVALFGPTTSISRTIEENKTTYTVPGTIIIRDEDLDFSKVPFRVFNIKDGASETVPNDYYVGLSDSSDYFIPRTNGGFTAHANPTSLSYGDLKEKYIKSYGTQNGQIKLTLGYYFNDSNIHSYTFSYILGRIENFGIKSFQVDHLKNISYYLTDNGGDFIEAKNGRTQKTQNQLIDGRKSNEYFSLSRQPKNPESKKAQERLRIEFISGTDVIPKTITIENNETLFTLLQLMKINTTNTISLDAFGFLEKNPNTGELDEEGPVNKITNRRKINIKIAIDYIYEQENKTDYYDELVSHTLENVTFIQENFPFGMREGGVIVNPSFDEKLNSEKVITQEVYNGLTQQQKNQYSQREDGKYFRIIGNKNTFVINVKDIEKDPDTDEPIPKNGLKIIFHTGAENPPAFEIFLDSDGQIGFSNGTRIVKPFS